MRTSEEGDTCALGRSVCTEWCACARWSRARVHVCLRVVRAGERDVACARGPRALVLGMRVLGLRVRTLVLCAWGGREGERRREKRERGREGVVCAHARTQGAFLGTPGEPHNTSPLVDFVAPEMSRGQPKNILLHFL